MKLYRLEESAISRTSLFRSSLILGAVLLTVAAPPATAQASDEEAVVLPAFSITEAPQNPYQSSQSMSTSRVATAIIDIPQTVSIVTGEFLRDTQSLRILDAAKYVTPVMESSLPIGADRVTLRGFQVSAQFVDGVVISGQDGTSMTLPPYNLERLEIVKGPNAILVPGGSPGGVINSITKSPVFRNTGTYAVTLAEYLGNSAMLDVNRVFGSKDNKAYRVVAAYWTGDGYSLNVEREGFLVAPSVSFAFDTNSSFTLKAEILRNKETNWRGLPIDPGVGTSGDARIYSGVPRDYSFGDDGKRRREEERVIGELKFVIAERVASRLFLMANHAIRDDEPNAGGANTGGLGGGRNPLTGAWTPGFVYNPVTFAPIPAPAQTTIFTRAVFGDYLEFDELHFKNDYAYTWEGEKVTSTTIGGLSANLSRLRWDSWASSADGMPAVDIANLAARSDTPKNIGPKTQNRDASQKDLQVFLFERLSLLDGVLTVAGGLSNYYGELSRLDTRGVPTVVTPSLSNDTTDVNWGIVAKPVEHFSVFYGYNRTGGALPTSILAGSVAPDFNVQVGTQKEFGVKTSLLEGRLTASASYFDISQSNFQVPNSQRVIDPSLPPFVFLDLESKGWEVEMIYEIMPGLTFLGNYTSFEMRDPLDIKQRAVPDDAGAFFLDYRFGDGPLEGLGINLGVSYKGRSPGDTAGGFTAASTPSNEIVNQPSFFLESYTNVDLGFSYRRDNWTARVTVRNLTDNDHVQAALNRAQLFPADPRHFAAEFTYQF